MTPLTCQKHLFSLPDDVHYLNCAYLGPLPKATEDAVVAGLRRKRVPTGVRPPDFFEDGNEVRRLFGAVIGGDPDRVAIHPSASYGVASLAKNVPLSPGQNIVLTHEQFPGNVYSWRRLAAESGGEVRMVRPPDSDAGRDARGDAWSARVMEAIDRDTAVVSMPHVHWTDGTRFDLVAIGERARDVDAVFVVDGTQSIGALPFGVGAVRPDAVVCAGYKWLLAPYSTSLAYFGKRFDGGVPLEETWSAREGSEDFQRLVHYRDGYQPGARRYDVGETANFALLPGLLASLRLVLEWGAERVQAYCGSLTAELIDVALERGFSVASTAQRGRHLFGIRMRADVELADLQRRLGEAGVAVSLRGDALRVSPNAYNDRGDVTALTEVLAAT